MNLYFEIYNYEDNKNEYFVQHNAEEGLPADIHDMHYRSTRIWRQSGDTVKFWKNRYFPIAPEVDPVEFTLIQLKSNPLNK